MRWFPGRVESLLRTWRTNSGIASGFRQGCLFRLRLRLSPQDQRGEQRDDEPNREGMNEREHCIEEWVFVQLFVFSDLLKFFLDGCRARPRGGELLNQMSAICVPETRNEVVVDHFPGYDVEDARYQGNGEADGKGFYKGNLTIADVVPVGSDADKHHQEREHYGGVADDGAAVEANPVAEGHQRYHHQRRDSAGNQPEGDNDLSHILVMPFIRS